MKITYFLLTTGLGVMSASSAIWWNSTPSSTAYTSGSTVTFDVDTSGQQVNGSGTVIGEGRAFAGIEVDASANADGFFYAQGGAGGQLVFATTSVIGTGESICFEFQFNMPLYSAARPFGAAGSRLRTAARFRVNNPIVGTLETTITGGEGFAALISAPPATLPGGDWTDTSNFVSATTDFVYQGSGNEFTSVDVPGETITTTNTTGNTNFVTDFVHRSRTHNTGEYSFDKVKFNFTNQGTDIAAGTLFNFTFEGGNPDAQAAAIAIPEPTSGLLLGLASLSLLARRKRL